MKFEHALEYAKRLGEDTTVMVDPNQADQGEPVYHVIRQFDVGRRISNGWVVVSHVYPAIQVEGRTE